MSVDKLVDSTQLDSDLTSVANAIRTKGGTSSQMSFPSGFVSAIENIHTGSTPTGTKEISITENGTTTEDVTDYAYAEIEVAVPASAVDSGTKNITANGTGQDVVGYAAVDVAVPNSYSAGDEGKVVDDGALVSQTAHADVTPTTSDQTIDTTTNNSIKVKGDADLVAGNIKKDVEIFGVTGSYEGSGGMAVQQGTLTPATNSNKLQITFASPISYLLVYLDPTEYSTIIADTSGVRRLIQYARTPNGTMRLATNTENSIHGNGATSGGPLSAISSIDENLWPATAGSGYLMAGYTYKWIAW